MRRSSVASVVNSDILTIFEFCPDRLLSSRDHAILNLWTSKEVLSGSSEKLNRGCEEEIGPPHACCTNGSLNNRPSDTIFGLCPVWQLFNQNRGATDIRNTAKFPSNLFQ
jgi:hypothetical protein